MTNTYTLKIDTNEDFYTAIFSRTYVMEILSESDKQAVINFKSYDTTPSGYRAGGSEQIFAQNMKVQFKDKNINKNIAKLALNFDTKLIDQSGCNFLNSSRKKLIEQLSAKINKPETVLDI